MDLRTLRSRNKFTQSSQNIEKISLYQRSTNLLAIIQFGYQTGRISEGFRPEKFYIQIYYIWRKWSIFKWWKLSWSFKLSCWSLHYAQRTSLWFALKNATVLTKMTLNEIIETCHKLIRIEWSKQQDLNF